MSILLEHCVDEFDNIHFIKEKLSQGGQGIVYSTRDADTAVKIVIDNAGEVIVKSDIVAGILKEFRKLRLLPVPREANITFPAALLSGKAGYVMTFLEDMRPVSFFIVKFGEKFKLLNKNEKIPQWLGAISDKNAVRDIIVYNKAGGLRSRLLALYKISSQLALLHGAGLVYGDISHNNIFFSKKEDRYNIWLIDADNLKYEGEKGFVYTPRYGAPELMQGKSGDGTMASDCHAFAVLAYEMLTMVHPFLGKKVLGGEVDWADTKKNDNNPEDQALMGLYPWVGDADDDSNSSDSGLPPVLLYDDEIAQLFQKTFGAGRIDPLKRPVIFHWPYAFARAADSTIQCPACSMSYRYDYKDSESGKEQCPYCADPKPQTIIMEAYSWENNALGKKQWTFVREANPSGGKIRFPSRLFSVFPLAESDMPVLEIEVSEVSVLIKKVEGVDMEFLIAAKEVDGGKFNKLSNPIRFNQSGGKNIGEFYIFAYFCNTSRMVICTIKDAVK